MQQTTLRRLSGTTELKEQREQVSVQQDIVFLSSE